MTGNELFREIGNINEKYVKEAEETKRATILTPAFRRTMVTAACLVICFGLYFGVRQLGVGGQSETASMEANTNSATGQADMSIKTESAVMDSATNSVTGADEESIYENTEDSAFWEELWPTDSEIATGATEADTESIEQTVSSESIADNKQEIVVQDGKQLFADMVVLDETVWLQSGEEMVDAFLEKVERGEEANLELVRTSDEEVYAFYYIRYNGKEYSLLTEWEYRENAEMEMKTFEASYGYLKVFEETLEDGSVYYVVGLGEMEDFTLRDLQIGTKGTMVILRCMK